MKRIIKESYSRITPQIAKDILEGRLRLEDFYVHGRNSERKFGDLPYTFQFTRSIHTAILFSDLDNDEENAKIYAVRPKNSAKVLNFRHDETQDMDRFVEKVIEVFDNWTIQNYEPYKGYAPQLFDHFEIVFNLDSTTYEEDEYFEEKERIEKDVRENYAPYDIVENALAYDDENWWTFLSILYEYDKEYPDFIHTPNESAIMIPNPNVLNRMEHYELVSLAKEA